LESLTEQYFVSRYDRNTPVQKLSISPVLYGLWEYIWPTKKFADDRSGPTNTMRSLITVVNVGVDIKNRQHIFCKTCSIKLLLCGNQHRNILFEEHNILQWSANCVLRPNGGSFSTFYWAAQHFLVWAAWYVWATVLYRLCGLKDRLLQPGADPAGGDWGNRPP